jgi:hypothetical protein
MLILTEFKRAYILDNIAAPVVPKNLWVYNAQVNDFMYAPLKTLEEYTGPTVTARINGMEMKMPASWYIVITESDTMVVDIVQFSSVSLGYYETLAISVEDLKFRLLPIEIIDYEQRGTVVVPNLARATAALHPVGPMDDMLYQPKSPIYSVMVSHQDLYTRYINGKNVYEIVF